MSRSRCHAHVWLTNNSAKWWKRYANHSRRIQEREEIINPDEDYTMNRRMSERVNSYNSPKDGRPSWGSDALAEPYKTRGK
jgi:hypothetical protein